MPVGVPCQAVTVAHRFWGGLDGGFLLSSGDVHSAFQHYESYEGYSFQRSTSWLLLCSLIPVWDTVNNSVLPSSAEDNWQLPVMFWGLWTSLANNLSIKEGTHSRDWDFHLKVFVSTQGIDVWL